jgi:predicted ATPase
MIAASDEGGFFGRATDLAELARLVATDGALVTIVGPPGVGKTRLAVELVKSLEPIDHLTCDVSELRTADALLERFAELLRVGSDAPGSVLERVGDALAEHGELLLLFDNVEQLIEAATPMLRALRQAAPRVRWLVTSREPLGLIGEWRHEVGPLSVDSSEAGGSDEGDAVRMLVDRVTRARGAAPAPSERKLFARIAARLDGLPLALELAASRIGTLGASAVETRLELQLDVLTHGPRDLDPRQRTLRRAIAWSWELLAPAEQRGLAQLSVLRGGFDLAAAEAVVDAASGALDLVQNLRQKSLLHARRDDNGDVRFGLYLSIREFAAGELSPAETAAAHLRHAAHFADVVARTSDPTALLVERDNVFAAIERCTAIASIETIPLAARLLLGFEPLIDRSPLEPYLERIEAFLATTASAEMLPAELRCGIQATAGRCMRRLGRLRDAKRLYADALAFARAIRHREVEARVHGELGMVAFFESRIEDALAQWRTSMAMQRELGNDRRLGLDQTRCGMILRESNRLFEARTMLADALVTHRRADSDDGIVITLAELAMIHLELGEVDEGERLLVEAARYPRDRRSLLSEAAVLARNAFMRWERGEYAAAATFAQRALVYLGQIGYRRVEAGLVMYRAINGLLAGTSSPNPRDQLEWARKHLDTDRRGSHLAGAWLGHLAIRDGAFELARQQFAALPALGDSDPVAVTSAILRLPLELGAPDAVEQRGSALADAELSTTGKSARASSFDVRLAMRAIAHYRDTRAPATATGQTSLLDVRSDGAAFTFAGTEHSLTRYRTLRRLLLKLVDARLATPGAALGWDALLAAGWPGERIHVEAARNRVKVAISTLRGMGLRDAIQHDGTGYLIDPRVDVRVVTG